MRTETAQRQLLTADEVAAQLRVGKQWIYRHAASGDLPHLRLGDEHGPLRVDSADLADYLDRARTEER
jgi:excisionase family DNA binding protein